MSSDHSSSADTIMIVDDNQDLLDLFSEALHDLGGFTVLAALDGVAALEQVVVGNPDCIVIDIVMPHLNGYQLVHALRGDPQTRDIPLVILTALAQDREKFTGLAAGADTYLVKPVTPHELIVAIRQAITINHAERVQRYLALADEPSQEL